MTGDRFLHFWDGHEFVSLLLVPLDQPISDQHRLGAVSPHLLVASIMEQDHVSAANLPGDFTLDLIGWGRIPVPSSNIPHDGIKAKLMGNSQRLRPTCSERRTKQARMLASGVTQSLIAMLQLGARFRSRGENQIGMREGVIANDVSCLNQLSHNVGPLLHVLADSKESSAYVLFGQDIEQAQGMRIIGTIVVSKRNLFRSRLQSNKGLSIPLAGGSHRLVARGARGRDSTQGEA